MTTPASIPASAEQTPVHTIADILRAMAHDPAIAKAVRQHVLDEELRQLPAAFRQLAATVEEYMVQTNRILADLQAGQARHDADIAELKTGQDELRAKATITDARKMVGRICDLANLRRPRFLESTDVFDIFDEADTSGVPPNELLSRCGNTPRPPPHPTSPPPARRRSHSPTGRWPPPPGWPALPLRLRRHPTWGQRQT